MPSPNPATAPLSSPNQTAVILDALADGVFTVDAEWRITSFNRAAEELTGVPRDEALGHRCSDVFRGSACENACPIRRALADDAPVIGTPVYVIGREGQRLPVSVSAAALKDDAGQVVGGVETFRDLRQVEELRKRLESGYRFEDLVSRNREMQQLFELLPTIAASDSTVLIHGDSGTGKELVARAIHNLGPRREGPFVALNCGALPDSLLESELFGYKKGAFTDARADKPGRFALAEKGTLLLDEVADVSQAMQMRLLRVLQERQYEPLGATHSVQADVRVIAASNRDLESLVQQGEFRRDLFYRINVIQLNLPMLRDRKEDIPLLVDHFVSRYNHLQGKDVAGVSEQALELLMDHDYPGNIRELENIVERAFILCSSGLIGPEHLPEGLRPHGADDGTDAGGAGRRGGATLRDLEKQAIAAALERHSGSRKEAAAELGIHKSTFFRKLKAYGIEAPLHGDRS